MFVVLTSCTVFWPSAVWTETAKPSGMVVRVSCLKPPAGFVSRSSRPTESYVNVWRFWRGSLYVAMSPFAS